MAYSTPSSRSTGDIITAAIWNQDVVSNTLAGANEISTAQGDMVYATAAETLARLAKGTAQQRLKVNAGATAPAWGGVYDLMHLPFLASGDPDNIFQKTTPSQNTWYEPDSPAEAWELLQRKLDFSRITNQASCRLSVLLATSGTSGKAELHNITTATQIVETASGGSGAYALLESAWTAMPDRSTEDTLGIRIYYTGAVGGDYVRIKGAWVDIRMD